MKTRSLLLCLLTVACGPSVSQAQVLWIGAGPAAFGGYRGNFAYGPGYVAPGYALGSRLYAPRFAAGGSIWPAAPAVLPLAPQHILVVRTGAGSVGGPIMVSVSGISQRDDEITQALDQARGWAKDPKVVQRNLLSKITAAIRAEATTPDLQKAKLDLIQALTDMADKVDTKKTTTTAELTVQWGKTQLQFKKQLGKTVEAIGNYLDEMNKGGTLLGTMPPTIDDGRRTRIFEVWNSIIGALKQAP